MTNIPGHDLIMGKLPTMAIWEDFCYEFGKCRASSGLVASTFAAGLRCQLVAQVASPGWLAAPDGHIHIHRLYSWWVPTVVVAYYLPIINHHQPLVHQHEHTTSDNEPVFLPSLTSFLSIFHHQQSTLTIITSLLSIIHQQVSPVSLSIRGGNGFTKVHCPRPSGGVVRAEGTPSPGEIAGAGVVNGCFFKKLTPQIIHLQINHR